MATTPIYNLTDTWNNGATVFTAVKMNVTDTASSASSLLLDLQVGGSSKLLVDKSGIVGSAVGQGVLFSANLLIGRDAGNEMFRLGANQFNVTSATTIGFTNSTTSADAGNRDVAITRVGAGILKITDNSTGAGVVVTQAVAVASLPSAATAGKGARAFVTDSSVTTFNTTVAAGGANNVPVFSDGTNWKVG